MRQNASKKERLKVERKSSLCNDTTSISPSAKVRTSVRREHRLHASRASKPPPLSTDTKSRSRHTLQRQIPTPSRQISSCSLRRRSFFWEPPGSPLVHFRCSQEIQKGKLFLVTTHGGCGIWSSDSCPPKFRLSPGHEGIDQTRQDLAPS